MTAHVSRPEIVSYDTLGIIVGLTAAIYRHRESAKEL